MKKLFLVVALCLCLFTTVHAQEENAVGLRFGDGVELLYEGENETYIEASAENSGSILYDKEIRDKPRTRRTKRNV